MEINESLKKEMAEYFGVGSDFPILHLNLMQKWFFKVVHDKEEEYRDIKPFYNRIFKDGKIKIKGKYYHPADVIICFSCGYNKDRLQMLIKCNGLSVGFGKPEWGASPDKQQYILKLDSKMLLKSLNQ